jgi:galactonate dehydratase
MKIEEVRSVVLGHAHLVRLTADDGTVGVGQSACWAYPEAVSAVVDRFAGYLVGQDPRDIERHWHHLYRMGPFRGSVLSAAVSAVDIALWDLKGKRYDAPVWDLLGGRARDRIRLHLILGGATSPEGVAGLARQAADDGFTAVKFSPLPHDYFDRPLAGVVAAAVETVGAVREAVGHEVDLILEIHRSLTPAQARPLIDALRPFRPLCVEDALQIDSIAAQADLARQTDVPAATGERLHSVWEFREVLERGGPQYVRADVGLAGGISHAKKIAAVAESHHAEVMWHNWLGPLLTAATATVNTVVPNMATMEFFPLFDEGPSAAGYTSGWRRAGGYLPVCDEPGIGVAVDWDALVPVDVLGRELWDIPRRQDGSVAFSV